MEKSNKKISKGLLWVSYVLQAAVSLFFLMGAIMNLLQTDEAIAGAMALGFPETAVFNIGIVLLVMTLLYLIPKTSGLGAILLTGWLGGAVATHIINGDSLFNTIFPIAFGLALWFALWLRQDKVRGLLSLK